MASTRQLHILAVILLHAGLVIESASVGQVDPQPYLHFVGFHGLEQHLRCEPVLNCNLVVIFLIQGGLEGEKSRIIIFISKSMPLN